MDNHDRMLRLKRLSSHDSLLAVLKLLSDTVIVAVNSSETFEALSKARRETAECPNTGAHERIPASRVRRLQHSNKRSSRGLLLGALVCVPLNWAAAGPRMPYSEITID